MSLAKKISVLAFGQGINVLVNLLFLPYMSRALSYEGYGSYGQTLLVVSAASTLVALGLSQIINVYLADQDKKNKDTLTDNLFVTFFISLFGFLVVYFSSNFFGYFFNNEVLPKLIRIFSFSILFIVPFNSMNTFLIFTGKVKTSVYISVFSNILKVILVISSIQLWNSLELAILGIVLADFVQFTVCLINVKTFLSFKPSKTGMIRQLKDGVPLGMTGIIGMIILYVDSIMVSNMLGVKEYAIYRNGAIEVPFVSTIYGAISAVILPEVAKLWKKQEIDEIFILKKKVIMNTIYLIYPILIFLLFNSRDIIKLYFGEMYINSALIFSVFNLTLLFRVNDYGDILITAKKGKFIFLFYLITFFFNIIVNYILILNFDAIGASISTVLSITLLAFLQLNKSLKLSSKKLKHLIDFKKLFIVILSCLSLASILFFSLNFISNDLTRLFLFSIIYFTIIILLFSYLNYFRSEIYIKLLPKSLKNLIK